MVPENFYQKIPELAEADPMCRSLKDELISVERIYHLVSEKLTEHDRDVIERYISLCEELEYQKTRLASAYYAWAGAKGYVP